MKKIYTIILLITLCLGCLVSVTKPAYAGCSEECKKSKNCSIAAKKKGGDVIFLRKIVRGGAGQSYGIEVAKLAGVPDRVIRRAHQILEELEADQPAAPAFGSKQGHLLLV